MHRRTAKVWRTTIATAGILLVGLSTVQPAFAAPSPSTPSTPAAKPSPAVTANISNLAGHKTKNLCAAPTHKYEMACQSIVDTEVMTPMATTGVPSGYGATDLQSAYAIPADTSGVKKTVAVVAAFDDVNAEADLAVYRAKYGLPACTSASGCFTKVDQGGGTYYPTANAAWAQETALDLDMVSAACPTCNVLLVEAQSAYLNDLGPGVDTAVHMGAVAVSNSYGGAESFDPSQFETFYKHPGVAITAAAGDSGFGVNYPAASQYVTAVGGTSLHTDSTVARGWAENAWGHAYPVGSMGTGSGCSNFDVKPTWQKDTGCTKRTVADIAAVADPSTGVAVYDSASGGWGVVGGTSVSSPLIAGMFATAGKPTAGTYPASYAYAVPSAANDTIYGSNGNCTLAYLCTSSDGYDGPTGVGTPNGAAALTDLTGKFTTAEATANLGTATSGITCAADGSCSKTYTGGKIKWTYAAGTVATPNVVVPPVTPPVTVTPPPPPPIVIPPLPAPTPPSPIQDKWHTLQGSLGRLGNSIGDEVGGLKNNGSMEKFQHGYIYYSKATGAHVIEGSIGDKWLAAGAQNSYFGYPTSDIVTGLKNGGSSQTFSSGAIVSSPSTGTHYSIGAIRGKWLGAGGQDSVLGYPTSDENPALGGGSYQSFQGGNIYWSPATGVNITHGAIGWLWTMNGSERGYFGYPISDEIAARGGGTYQRFQHGAIYWSPASGVNMVIGAIGGTWTAMGAENSRLGYPTSGEFTYGSGVRQNFQHGYITWSPQHGIAVH